MDDGDLFLEDKFVLSPYQIRIWKLSLTNIDSTAFNIGVLFELQGVINIEIIKDVLEELFELYDIFKLSFIYENLSPKQFIGFNVPLPSVSFIDLSKCQIENQEKSINEINQEAIKCHFDLGKPPLCNVKLIKISDTHIKIIFVAHHIIVDGWSFKILAQDLFRLYLARLENRKIELVNGKFLPCIKQVSGFYAPNNVLNDAYYYIKKLKNLVALYPCNAEYDRKLYFDGGLYSSSVPFDTLKGLKQIALKHKLPLQSLLLSSYFLTLFIYTARDDIFLLLPVSNREKYEFKHVMGLFANLIIIRQKIDRKTLLLDFTKQVHQNFLESYDNKYLPFDILIEQLSVDAVFRPSMLQLFFDYQHEVGFHNKDVTLNISELHSKISRFYLSLVCKKNSNSIKLDFTYSTQHFDFDNIKLIENIFQKVLMQLIIDENQNLDLLAYKVYPEAQKIVIYSNYTAEPIQKSLQHWLTKLEYNYHVSFSFYNDIMQNVLNSHSSLFKEHNGLNVLLLSLNNVSKNSNPQNLLARDSANIEYSGLKKCTLPNNMEIFYHLKGETDFLYREIFKENNYTKYGIELNDNACIIDIGANIGLFTLYANQLCKKPNIIALEPIPDIFNILRANINLYGLDNVKIINKGVSNIVGVKKFSYYPNSSLQSGYYADTKEDELVVRSFIMNQIAEIEQNSNNASFSDDILDNRFDETNINCPVVSVSDVIKEYALDKIDLLKIDAEKSEMDVINGIERYDWDKIKQIVIEVHDKDNRLIWVENELKSRNFIVCVEQEKLFEQTNIYTIYAKQSQQINIKSDNQGFLKQEQKWKSHFDLFYEAINTHAYNIKVPTIIGLDYNDGFNDKLIDYIKEKLLFLCDKHKNIMFEDITNSERKYLLGSKYDDYSYKIADMPYTEEYFAFLGTILARKINSIISSASKVIIVDCDNTLWDGICGEDLPEKIRILDKNILLQKFLLEQYENGVLLCICSKNNEKDALEVFKTKKDMIIGIENFVSWRINWQAKSDNIISLAEELNLGLDSFIFIDDSPVECMEVASCLPEVIVLQFPQDVEKAKLLFSHIWSLDKNQISKEDKIRSEMYKQEKNRDKIRIESRTTQEFISLLEVNVEILQANEDHVQRLSQMMFRINQFNLTLVKYSVSELQEIINSDDYLCFIVKVIDKFGDYGIAGAMILKKQFCGLIVELLLVSCRALGRGVELSMLKHIAKVANNTHCSEILLYGIPSGKNYPALEFLEDITKYYNKSKTEKNYFSFTSEEILAINFTNESKAILNKNTIKKDQLGLKSNNSNKSKIFQSIAEYSFDIQCMSSKINQRKLTYRGKLSSNYVSAQTKLEQQLVNIWEDVLNIEQIGIKDNFFELGGHSLLATSIATQIKQQLNVEMVFSDMLSLLTIDDLARHLKHKMTNQIMEEDEQPNNLIKSIDKDSYIFENEI